ncbi:MAG TPA: cyclic nucleotide-binding domain-containing protein, partial [Elusimicrobiota bacterium]|nr:cyclic nucleotide-binding domain-containing protein [Elusimicrobiota bacterium]
MAEKPEFLKSLRLFEGISDAQLETLSGVLESSSYPDGAVVFEEGSRGEGMYFVASGAIRIAKKLDPGRKDSPLKELALLRPGDCFGEMEIIDSKPRSADAIASGDARLLRLSRDGLNRWLEASPAAAVGFFTHLLHVVTGRLRRSTTELTLILDLSQTLLEPFPHGKALLEEVLRQMLPHFGGAWSAGAYLHNPFTDEMDLAAASPGFEPGDRFKPADRPRGDEWLDERTFRAVFPGKRGPFGYLVFSR